MNYIDEMKEEVTIILNKDYLDESDIRRLGYLESAISRAYLETDY
jgi:hypothetical protein